MISENYGQNYADHGSKEVALKGYVRFTWEDAPETERSE